MNGPQRGDKITYVSPGHGELMHATVQSRTGDTFYFAACWGSQSHLTATDAQEHSVWVRGYLRWWRPSHRAARKALLAAYALGNDRVQLVRFTVLDEAIKSVQHILAKDYQKLVDDGNRLFGPRRRSSRTYRWR